MSDVGGTLAAPPASRPTANRRRLIRKALHTIETHIARRIEDAGQIVLVVILTALCTVLFAIGVFGFGGFCGRLQPGDDVIGIDLLARPVVRVCVDW